MKLISLFLPIALLTGCALGEPQEGDSRVFKIPTNGLEVSKLIAQASTVNCLDSNCPPQVGMVVGALTNNVYQCTGFFVEKDLVATNAHCIPDDLREVGADCRERVWMTFPQVSGHGVEKIGCSTVESISFGYGDTNGGGSDTVVKKDFAFIRLARTSDRGVFPLHTVGVRDRSMIRITKVNPTLKSDRLTGEMESIDCMVDQGIFDGARDPESSFVTLPGCSIIGGNSGSPGLFGESVATIIHAISKRRYDNSLYSEPKLISLGSNFACIGIPGQDGQFPSACDARLRIEP